MLQARENAEQPWRPGQAELLDATAASTGRGPPAGGNLERRAGRTAAFSEQDLLGIWLSLEINRAKPRKSRSDWLACSPP